MKNKLLYVLTISPIFITVISLLFLPETLPAHYGLDGEVTRFGSKYELLLLPVISLLMFIIFNKYISKLNKSIASKNDEISVKAKSQKKELYRGNMFVLAGFNFMQVYILYLSFQYTNTTAPIQFVISMKPIIILVSALLIVLGNIMPKVQKNHVFGMRTSWSLYNETTWAKSNRVAGILFVIAGFVNIVLTIFLEESALLVAMSFVLAIALVTSLVYSWIVYKQNRSIE